MGECLIVKNSPTSESYQIYLQDAPLGVYIAEENLCQTKRRVRSLLSANEELAYCRAVQILPARCTTEGPIFLEKITVNDCYQ